MAEIRVTGLESARAGLDGASAGLLAALSGAVLESTLLLQREIKERTPIGATSVARESFLVEFPKVLGDVVLGAVGSSAAHIQPLELGTRPHWAPLDPLADWVRAKFGVGEGEAAGIAKRIQYKIAARGTAAAGMVNKTMAWTAGQVPAIFDRHIARAMRGSST